MNEKTKDIIIGILITIIIVLCVTLIVIINGKKNNNVDVDSHINIEETNKENNEGSDLENINISNEEIINTNYNIGNIESIILRNHCEDCGDPNTEEKN